MITGGNILSGVSNSPKQLGGYDLFNQVIAENADPLKAVPNDNGSAGSIMNQLVPTLGEEKARKLFTAASLFRQDKSNSGLNKEQRLQKFYESISNDKGLESLKSEMKGFFGTGDQNTMFGTSPLMPLNTANDMSRSITKK